jgi:glycosyltransferase involved in cell wall biosynthesis
MKTILYITEESPFPAFGGGRIRRNGILKALSASGYRVHAVIGNKFRVDLNRFGIDHVRFYEFNNKTAKLSVIFRYFKIFNKNRKLMRLIERIMEEHKIDLVFLDCYFIGQYISYFKKQNIPVIYGTENAQSLLNKMRPAKNPLKKLEKYANYYLQAAHERLYYNRADAVITVSENDRQFHQRFVSPAKVHIVPNFLDFSLYPCGEEKENYIVMTGSFRAFQNSAGLNWFLEKVWDEELSRCTQLMVAGYYSRELLERIKQKTDGLENVQALGEVDDIAPHISRARVAVIPLLHGSGSRLKILEAMALKTPVLSTTRGAEGIEHEDTIIIADRAEDFKHELLKLINGGKFDYYRTKTEKAYQVALTKYSMETNQQKIEKIIENARGIAQ